MKNLLLNCRLLIILLVSASKADLTSDTYKAAVVEYNVGLYDSIYDEVDKTLPDYLQKITEAKQNGAEIIVFPELTMNSRSPITVPDEEEKAQPWTEPDKYSKVLYQLSKAARDESIYVVVNVAEKALNETAESDEEKYLFFNTNFVLDTNGTIISRYRKINLYGEAGRIPSLDNKLGVFETNFGVKFGHFICFDILFPIPALQVLHKANVTNVIYPAMWFSELPFLTAVEIQESWAYTHNVNLLAAGANQPKVGSTGSGIYSGTMGRLTAIMHGTSKSEIIYADVPKNPRLDTTTKTKKKHNIKNDIALDSSSTMDNLFLKQDDLTVYRSVILNETGEYSVKHKDVVCAVNVTFLPEEETEDSMYIYRLVAYDGIKSYTYATGGVSDCAVVACSGTNITSCAKRYANYSEVWPKNTISSIELHAIVPEPAWNENMTTESIVYHPVTLDTSIMPIAVGDYDYTIIPNQEGFQEIIMKITDVEEYDDILFTFGITGRVFERDGLPVTDAGAINMCGYLTLIISLLVSMYLAY